MLAELSEDAATGAIAEIYNDIRWFWAVPYVSSLQRHLATRPGWLEWSWASLAPAFTSGAAQTIAWRVADDLDLPSIEPLPAKNLNLDQGAIKTVQDVCASFVRVAPVNLMFAGMLRRLLDDQRPDGSGWLGQDWSPPVAMPALPAMIEMDRADETTRAALLRLGTDVAGTPFVPGLYRILARWPDLAVFLAGALTSVAKSSVTAAARTELLQGIDGAVATLFPQLPVLEGVTIPDHDHREALLAVLGTYRRTSPEMVIFGQVIGKAVNSAT